MNALFALLLSLKLVAPGQEKTLSTSAQVTLAVQTNVATQERASVLVAQPAIYDPTEGRSKTK